MSYNKFYLYKKQVSYDNGATWEDVIPLEQVPSGDPIGTYETLAECEAVTPARAKFKATYSDGTTYSAECTSQDEALTTETTKPSGYDYSAMTTAEIGDCVTSIGSSVFSNCRGLTSIAIPNSVTSIGFQAFRNCTSLTSCTIGSGVTSIGTYAFSGCSSLTSIDIPNGVTSIGSSAFFYCSGLTSIDIPDSVTSIRPNVFQNCTSLTSIDIPSGVTSISSNAFKGCSGLTSITVEAVTPPTLGNMTFDDTNNCPIYVPCESVEDYKTAWSAYKSRIQCIEPFDGKFKATYSDSTTYSAECDSSTDLTSATTRPSGYDYSAMTSAEIGDCVARIGSYAFERCSSLTSVTIGSSVTIFGFYVFNWCTSLTSITCNAVVPPSLNMTAFANTLDTMKIYVPAASVEAYKTAQNWTNYADRIQAIP